MSGGRSEPESIGDRMKRVVDQAQAQRRELACCDRKPGPKDYRKALRAWGVLDKYLGWKLEDFGLKGPLDWAEGGYFIHGVQGSGKSCLAAAIVRDRMDPDHPRTLAVPKESLEPGRIVKTFTWGDGEGLWLRAIRLGWRVKDSWGRERLSDVMDKLSRHRLVVLDDLASENPDVHCVEAIMDLVESAVNGSMPLVVTSNLSRAELGEFYGNARIASRLGDLREIVMPEVDHRSARAKSRSPLQVRRPPRKEQR
ncbi:MAG: hypothetical protein GF320_04105 [Armatimonadia bacterium]|nr:hypothetical protein [Armatimonadia bacterium]